MISTQKEHHTDPKEDKASGLTIFESIRLHLMTFKVHLAFLTAAFEVNSLKESSSEGWPLWSEDLNPDSDSWTIYALPLLQMGWTVPERKWPQNPQMFVSLSWALILVSVETLFCGTLECCFYHLSTCRGTKKTLFMGSGHDLNVEGENNIRPGNTVRPERTAQW